MRDNDHVELHEVRGFVSEDLPGAFGEADAIAKGTRCKNYLFSASLNPPQNAQVTRPANERGEAVKTAASGGGSPVLHKPKARKDGETAGCARSAAEGLVLTEDGAAGPTKGK